MCIFTCVLGKIDHRVTSLPTVGQGFPGEGTPHTQPGRCDPALQMAGGCAPDQAVCKQRFEDEITNLNRAFNGQERTLKAVSLHPLWKERSAAPTPAAAALRTLEGSPAAGVSDTGSAHRCSFFFVLLILVSIAQCFNPAQQTG